MSPNPSSISRFTRLNDLWLFNLSAYLLMEAAYWLSSSSSSSEGGVRDRYHGISSVCDTTRRWSCRLVKSTPGSLPANIPGLHSVQSLRISVKNNANSRDRRRGLSNVPTFGGEGKAGSVAPLVGSGGRKPRV